MNGLAGGSPHLQKTVLPVEAVANVSIRLAPGQKVERDRADFERLLREAAPAGRRGRRRALGERAARDRPARRARDPARRSTRSSTRSATRPLLVRSGGTIPIVPALCARGIPTIVTGFALNDSNIHSPNERLLAEYLPLGVDTAAELFRRLAELR